jgi:four helix bundle protein
MDAQWMDVISGDGWFIVGGMTYPPLPQGHRRLVVWQRALELTMECYAIARSLPDIERRGLADQIRRAAASVPANIAEGNGQYYSRAYGRHLSIARGSLMELDTHLEIALRAGYIDYAATAKSFTLIDNVGRMLTRLSKAIAPIQPQ